MVSICIKTLLTFQVASSSQRDPTPWRSNMSRSNTCLVVQDVERQLKGFPNMSRVFRAEIHLGSHDWLTACQVSSTPLLYCSVLQHCNMQTSQCAAWERCSSPIPLPAAVPLFVWFWNSSQPSKIAALWPISFTLVFDRTKHGRWLGCVLMLLL